jgi:hypothetical protein
MSPSLTAHAQWLPTCDEAELGRRRPQEAATRYRMPPRRNEEVSHRWWRTGGRLPPSAGPVGVRGFPSLTHRPDRYRTRQRSPTRPNLGQVGVV